MPATARPARLKASAANWSAEGVFLDQATSHEVSAVNHARVFLLLRGTRFRNREPELDQAPWPDESVQRDSPNGAFA